MRQVPTLSEWDAEDVLSALQAHAQGQFRASAMLADYLGQSDAVAGVLDTLRRSVVGLPFDLEVPEGTPDPARSAALAKELRRQWPRMVSRGAAAEIVKWAALMGFCVCERVYRLDPRTGRWGVTLKPWHPCFVRWEWSRGCFVVQTQTGEEDVTPTSVKWCLFTDIEESRPWMSGAVRAIGLLALICWWLDRDGARWSERHGLPPLGAKVPMAQSEDARTNRFLSDLEDLGTEPIIRLPQGRKDEPSFDIEWKELKNATAWQGFLEPNRDIRARIATVLVGQPLTSMAGVGGSGSYALGKVQATVRQDVLESYALLLGTTRQHAILPWMRINETADRQEAEAVAPCSIWDAAPPADAKADAESSKAEAEALQAWKALGVLVDAEGHARARGVRILAAPKPDLAAPTTLSRALLLRAPSNLPERDPERPLLRWRVTPGPNTCEECRGYERVTLRRDDPWWSGHVPPLHPHCKCYLESVGESDAGGDPTPADELADLPEPVVGYGTGRIPLSAEDAQLAGLVLVLAVAVGIAVAVLGRAPKDGGTGHAYNPDNPEPGAHKRAEWVEIGAGVTQNSGEPWPAWDEASQEARIEATLAYELARYDGLTESEAIERALATDGLSAGARKILESMRDGARFVAHDEAP